MEKKQIITIIILILIAIYDIKIYSSKTLLLVLFLIIFYYTYKKSFYKSKILLLGQTINILIVYLLKETFKIPREKTIITDPYGFPSGHSSFMFYLIPYAYSINKKIGVTYTIISILVVTSRIILKEHTILDVTIGIIIGITLSYLTIKKTKF